MKQMLLTLMVVFAAPLLLVNCNSNSGSGTAVAPGPAGGANASNYGQGGCLHTSGGCLPQGTCPTNFGAQGLECLPATGPNGVCTYPQVTTQFGCLSRESCPVGQAMYEGTCVAETRSASRPRY